MKMSEEEFDAVLDTNLKGTFHTMRFVSRQMLKQREGRIINLASMLSFLGGFNTTAYTASKHAVMGLTRVMASEWGHLGINVNAIAPGWIKTNLSATDLTWFVTKAVGVNLDSGVSGDALPGDGSVTYGSTRYCYELEPGKSLEMINRLVNPYTASLTAEDVNIFQVSKQNGRGYRATASDFQTTDSSTDTTDTSNTTTGRDPEYD